MSGEEFLLPAPGCERFIASLLEKLQCPVPRAQRWARLLTETSLLGYDTHGIRMLDRYVDFIEGGGMDPRVEPAIEKDEAGCLKLDGRGGMGHLAADHAASLAIARARQTGIACATVRNSNHVGACGVYTRQAALQGMIGIASAVSRPGMAPWGGKQAMIGLVPLSAAAPATPGDPFLLDMASSVTSMGKITEAADSGRPIPDSWALDREGRPTVDPRAATGGTLLPVGGYKGAGLAMALEILTALLGGGLFSQDVRSWIAQTEKPMGASFLFIAIDISKWQDPERFSRTLAHWLAGLADSPRREGFDQISYPGQRAGACFRERSASGIPVDAQVAAMFRSLAERFELESPVK